jgi:exosortase A-associated hydrolase 2
MNKARRMAALQARRLAQEGWSVVQLDLHGCGDSVGEFAEARWETWVDDVRAALAWLRSRCEGPMSLWGLRLGATLACDVARDAALELERLVLWQPVVAGEQFITQFLRVRLASEMLADGVATTALRGLRAELAQGRSLEIGGYELHPNLAQAIARQDLSLTVPEVKRVAWLEVAAEPGVDVRPSSRRVVEAWGKRGMALTVATVGGEPFWATIEIAECEALLLATSQALREAG